LIERLHVNAGKTGLEVITVHNIISLTENYSEMKPFKMKNHITKLSTKI